MSKLHHWSQATGRMDADNNLLVRDKFGLPVHCLVVRWLVFDLLMYREQRITVPQNRVVPPAGKPQASNLRPQRGICIYRRCISRELSRSLGYAPNSKVGERKSKHFSLLFNYIFTYILVVVNNYVCVNVVILITN